MPVLDAASTPAVADGGQLLGGDGDGETTTPYTTHIEPADQGGEKYVRCEGCDREILSKYGGRSKLSYKDGCAHSSEIEDSR